MRNNRLDNGRRQAGDSVGWTMTQNPAADTPVAVNVDILVSEQVSSGGLGGHHMSSKVLALSSDSM
jgi:hypothetical protein